MNPVSSPAHAMEYVAQYIIKHNHYRDDEITSRDNEIGRLKNVLVDFGIVQCNECGDYDDDCSECYICEVVKCGSCSDIDHVYLGDHRKSKDLCGACRKVYCNWCLIETNGGTTAIYSGTTAMYCDKCVKNISSAFGKN